MWKANPIGNKYADMRAVVKSRRGVYNVYKVKQILDGVTGISHCQPVKGASVPIVKFMYQGNMECDIAVNDLGGW